MSKTSKKTRATRSVQATTPSPTPSVSSLSIDQVVIDDEFKTVLPPLSDDVEAELRALIRVEGFTGPLMVWRGTNRLIDGYHRHMMWKSEFEPSGMRPPAIVEIDLPDRPTVVEWILRHQRARRELSKVQHIEAALRQKPALSEKAKQNQRRGVSLKKVEGQQPVDVLARIGEIVGVSRETVAKAERVLSSGMQEIIDQLRMGELTINAAALRVRDAACEEPDTADNLDEEPEVETPPVPAATDAPTTDCVPPATTSSSPKKADKGPLFRSVITETVELIGNQIDELHSCFKRGELVFLQQMPAEHKRLAKLSKKLTEIVDLFAPAIDSLRAKTIVAKEPPTPSTSSAKPA